jgi:hypothetical protein
MPKFLSNANGNALPTIPPLRNAKEISKYAPMPSNTRSYPL